MIDLEARAMKILSEGVSRIRDKAASNASWSSRIPKALSVGQAGKAGGSIFIDLKVDISEKGAPEAMAFEKGSGVHGESGQRYKIEPDKADKLAFPISRWPNYQPPPNVDWAVFPGPISKKDYVMHPGVRENPFIQPAIDEEEPRLTEKLAEWGLQLFIEDPVTVVIK